jgi:hypothetical protein
MIHINGKSYVWILMNSSAAVFSEPADCIELHANKVQTNA